MPQIYIKSISVICLLVLFIPNNSCTVIQSETVSSEYSLFDDTIMSRATQRTHDRKVYTKLRLVC